MRTFCYESTPPSDPPLLDNTVPVIVINDASLSMYGGTVQSSLDTQTKMFGPRPVILDGEIPGMNDTVSYTAAFKTLAEHNPDRYLFGCVIPGSQNRDQMLLDLMSQLITKAKTLVELGAAGVVLGCYLIGQKDLERDLLFIELGLRRLRYALAPYGAVVIPQVWHRWQYNLVDQNWFGGEPLDSPTFKRYTELLSRYCSSCLVFEPKAESILAFQNTSV
jgi:hypothetical protein